MQINTEWTEELLQLMFEKRLDRIRATAATKGTEVGGVYHKRVSNEEFFRRHKIKVIKHARGN